MSAASPPTAEDRPRPDPIPREELEIRHQGNGGYRVLHGEHEVGTAFMAGDGAEPFVSLVVLADGARGRGVCAALYDFVELERGVTLVPNPLGLSADAQGFWRDRLEGYASDVRMEVLRTALDLGRRYGLRDSHIVEGRLDRVFQPSEIEQALAPVVEVAPPSR